MAAAASTETASKNVIGAWLSVFGLKYDVLVMLDVINYWFYIFEITIKDFKIKFIISHFNNFKEF